jgi:tetratricopeptide (TPR) repeat protein
MNNTVSLYRAAQAALLRNPDDPQALLNQFVVLSDKGDPRERHHYLPLAKRAYDLAPESTHTVFNYGSALHRAGRWQEALALYQEALRNAPADRRADYHHHVGIAFRALGYDREAIIHYEEALKLCDAPIIRRDRALCLMAMGQLMRGFEAFECRRALAEAEAKAGSTFRPAMMKQSIAKARHYQGEPLEGKSLVVYHEEGAGDFMMLSRFIPRLRELGASRIELTGPVPALLDFVDAQLGTDGVLPLDDGTDEPFACDYVLGSLSIPWRTGVEYSNISGRAYFRADSSRHVPRRAALNVGLAWRGNPAYANDVHRSMDFSELTPLFDLSETAFYSLQTGAPGREVSRLGYDGFVADLAPFERTWAETASVIEALDVVVTVDTAIAHLAGALGKPVLIMVTNYSDWRWNRHSEMTPWYDSARVIRQAVQDDWRPVIGRVREYLERLRDERRQAAEQDLPGSASQSAAE